MIRAAIIDDEPPARRELQRLLVEHGGVQVVGEAGSVQTAIGLLSRTRLDVVFLDITLGDGSGFDVLGSVDPATCVVFVTAHDAYATRAFDEAALDYLVKPVEPGRLAETLARVDRFAGESDERVHRPAVPGPFAPGKWIFLDRQPTPEFLRVEDIALIEVCGKSSRFVTSDGRQRDVAQPLRVWQRVVPPRDFLQANRSTLVNLAHVLKVEPWSHYTYRVFVRGAPAPVVMSRRRAQELRSVKPHP